MLLLWLPTTNLLRRVVSRTSLFFRTVLLQLIYLKKDTGLASVATIVFVSYHTAGDHDGKKCSVFVCFRFFFFLPPRPLFPGSSG